MGLMQEELAAEAPEMEEQETPQQEAAETEAPEVEAGEHPPTNKKGGSIMQMVMRAINRPQMKKAILKAAASENPENALAGIAYGLINGIDEASGNKIPMKAMPRLAMEIVTILSELATAASGGGNAQEVGGKTMEVVLDQAMQDAQKASASAPQQQGGPPQGPQGQQPQQMQPMEG